MNPIGDLKKIWLTNRINSLLLLNDGKRWGIYMFCTQFPLILMVLWLRFPWKGIRDTNKCLYSKTLTGAQIYYQIRSQKWEGSIFYKIVFPHILQNTHQSFCLKMVCRNWIILCSYLPNLSQCIFSYFLNWKKNLLSGRRFFLPLQTNRSDVSVYEENTSFRVQKQFGKKFRN